jgi:hypothetical protein
MYFGESFTKCVVVSSASERHRRVHGSAL